MGLDCLATSDNLYRYWLKRAVPSPEAIGKMGIFLMLNPSRARGNQDDPTQRKCEGFSRRLGFDTYGLINLFAFSTPYQDELFLKGYENAVGEDGCQIVHQALHAAKHHNWPVIAAWGSTSKLRTREKEFVGIRAREVARYAEKIDLPLYCLHTTEDGTPRHPLMLGYEHASLKPWSPT